MTTICTCGACGDRHTPRPAIDWTNYEADVLAFVDLWLAETEAALAAIREGRKPARSMIDGAEERIVNTYFPNTRGYFLSSLESGKAYLGQGGEYTDLWRAGEGVIWPAHATRPSGAPL